LGYENTHTIVEVPEDNGKGQVTAGQDKDDVSHKTRKALKSIKWGLEENLREKKSILL
jgi:hypothetical protein